MNAAPFHAMAHRHPLQRFLAPVLAPLSLLYGGASLARRRLTAAGVLPRWMPPVPCLSVGNISWGGTGKTPVTDWLLDESARRGLRAVVLTRGYGARPPRTPLWVRPFHRAAEAGDEPLMLALRHPGAAVLVDPDRNRAARMILDTAGKPGRNVPDVPSDTVELPHAAPDLFLLDDGFQRVSTGRHLDLVLLDPDDIARGGLPDRPPSNWNRVLPWGTWREPAASLSAADAFLLKTTPEEWPALAPELAARLAPFPRPVFAFQLQPTGLRPCGMTTCALVGSAATTPGPGAPYFLLTGVGNPAQVRNTAERVLGRPPLDHLCYADHHDFRAHADDIRARVAAARAEAGRAGHGPGVPVICTAKDAVKLDFLTNLHSLDVTADFFASLAVPAIGALSGVRGPSGEPGPDGKAEKQPPLFPVWLGRRLDNWFGERAGRLDDPLPQPEKSSARQKAHRSGRLP